MPVQQRVIPRAVAEQTVLVLRIEVVGDRTPRPAVEQSFEPEVTTDPGPW